MAPQRLFGLLAVMFGLLGASSYEIVRRVVHSQFLDRDFVHGIWVGICIGIQIFGLVAMLFTTRKRSA